MGRGRCSAEFCIAGGDRQAERKKQIMFRPLGEPAGRGPPSASRHCTRKHIEAERSAICSDDPRDGSKLRVTRRQDLLELFDQRRKVFCNRIPNDVDIDVMIDVYQDVAHVDDVLPWYSWHSFS